MLSREKSSRTLIMSESGKTSSETNVSTTQNTGEKNAESMTNCSLPAVEIPKCSDVQVSLKQCLPDIQAKVSQEFPNLPIPTQRQIPVNEIRKVRQKPRRVLPCLPPIVREILQWSIHPEEVLRGAASVSHLFNLPTINEEVLPIAQLIEEKDLPTVPKEKRILRNVPPTINQALPSNKPGVVCKPLPKFRAEFRKRMQPSLPTIKERASPMLPEVERSSDRKLEFTENHVWQDQGIRYAEVKEGPSGKDLHSIKKKKYKHWKSKQKVRETKAKLVEKEAMADPLLMTNEPLQSSEITEAQKHTGKKNGAKKKKTPLCFQRKVKQPQKSLYSETEQILLNHERKAEQQLPIPLSKENAQISRQGNEVLPSVYPEVNRSLPSLTPADTNEWLCHKSNEAEEMPRLRATLARRSKTLFQPSAEERKSCFPNMKAVLPNTPSIQEAIIPRPPSTPKGQRSAPLVTRKCSTLIRPLKNIPTTQEHLVPRPPSTPERHSRKQSKNQASFNRPLPSIPPTEKSLVPKPPSTPKKMTSARPVSRHVCLNKNKKLPGIQLQAEEQPMLDKQSLVKFPLSSVHLDHPAAGAVQSTMKSNFQPLAKETKQNR